MRRGRLRVTKGYEHAWSLPKMKALFSIFYPYKMKMMGVDDKITLYGCSPFFQEVPKDMKNPKYPLYEPEFEEIGGEITATLKCVWKPRGM